MNPDRIDDALKGGSTNDFAYQEVLQRVRGESDNTVRDTRPWSPVPASK